MHYNFVPGVRNARAIVAYYHCYGNKLVKFTRVIRQYKPFMINAAEQLERKEIVK